jgi:hypothetical protein
MSDRKQIRSYWKPDGKTVHAGNEKKIKDWLKQHALSTAPGAFTVFLHSPVHESARKHLARAVASLSTPGKKEHQP